MTKQAKTPAPVAAPATVATAPEVAPSAALAALAATLAAAPVPVQPAPQAVALRGGLAITAVRLTGKPYRVTAPHNVAWWATLAQVLAQHGGTAPVPAVVKAGLPATHVAYLVRRGYLQGA